MKEVLQQVKEELEQAYDNPKGHDLDRSIRKLQDAKEQYGDKGTMLNDAIRSLTQAKHSIAHMETANDFSASSAFGEAHNAIEQAIESFMEVDNDPV